jgi:hypothetical protein
MMLGQSIPITTNDFTIPLLVQPTHKLVPASHAVVEGGQAHLQTTLLEGGTNAVIDSGSEAFTWGSSSLGITVQEEGGGSGQGGLTTDQALQLQQTQQATWPQHLVDNLTLQALGAGSSELPINANLTSPVFAVIVRITAIPPDLLPQTPDDDYWVKTLAVVRIFRGSDLWLRVPIHTSSKIVNLWIEGIALGLMDAVLTAGWLLDLTLQTTFLPGVEGQVFLMRVP